MDINATFG
ncbi:hypothetical protein AYI69_g4077, partial [Smittium culicis]